MADLSKPSLPAFSWIGHLKEDDRDLLSSYGEFFPGHPGSIIIQEGEEQTEVFVVIKGRLEVTVTQEDGTPTLLATAGPGETLGEISLFTPGPATATVTATEFTQLWRIADDDLIQFMTDNPGAGNVLLRTLATILAQRLRQVDPQSFGLSAYAVVDSPDLPPTPESELPEEEGVLEGGTPETTVPAEQPAAPVSMPTGPVRPISPALSPLTPTADDDGEVVARPGMSEVPARKAIRTGTQPLPDPDELEPL